MKVKVEYWVDVDDMQLQDLIDEYRGQPLAFEENLRYWLQELILSYKGNEILTPDAETILRDHRINMEEDERERRKQQMEDH